MRAAEGVGAVPPGRDLPDIGGIERELAALWKQAAAPQEDGSPPAVIRACVMNLVACCTGGEQVERLQQLAVEVTSMIPARVLVAIEDSGDTEGGIKASLSTRCALGTGRDRETHICCEQVIMRAAGPIARHLPDAIVPLLLPDLPVVLWWPDQPSLTGDPGLRLVQHADWLVVDSCRFSQPAAQLQWLSQLDRPIADMTWQRLRGWRDLAAGLFDARGFDSYPERISRIELTCEPDLGSPSEGLLLGAWIASRLKWHPGSAGGQLNWHLVRRGGEAGDFLMISRPASREESDGSRPGRVLSLVLHAGDATFSLRRSGQNMLTGSVEMPSACPVPRTARVVERDDATLLTRSLQAGWRDPIYDDALALAARLLGPDLMESAT